MSDHDFSTSQAWDSAAERMIRLMAKFSNPSLEAYQKIFERLDDSRSFSSATTILDIGCGSGLGVAALAKAPFNLGLSSDILAIDFSPEMVDHVLGTKRKILLSATSNLEKERWSRFTAKVMDVSNMKPIDTGIVSHAFANFVLFGVENAEKALKEILRVLEPDGVFAMTSFRRVGWIECMSNGIQEVVDRPLPLPGFDPGNRWANSESVRLMLERAGFCDAQAEEIDIGLAVDNIESFPSDMMAVPALAKVSTMLSEAELDQAFQIVRNKLRTNHTDSTGHVRLKATCILGWARK